MSHPLRVSLRLAATIAFVWMLGCSIVARADVAGDPTTTSLDLVPRDAAFYRACIAPGWQIDVIRGSRAWAKLAAMPVCRAGADLAATAEAELARRADRMASAGQPGAAEVHTLWNDPQTQRLLALLRDMFDQEIFVFGDAGFVDLAELVQEVACETVYDPAVAQLLGAPSQPGRNPYRDRLVAALASRADRIKLPNVVVGFKVRDVPRAVEHVGKIELSLGGLCWSVPELRGRMGRAQVGDATFVTLTLDGKLLPLGNAPAQADEKTTPERRLVEAVRNLRLVVAVGVKGDYLLVSVGSSLDVLAGLGQGASLADREELKRLRSMTGVCTSVSYCSQALRGQIHAGPRHVAALAAAAREHLSAAPLDPPTRERLHRDLGLLAEDVAAGLRKPGAIVSVSRWTDRGVEWYTFDYGEHPWRDGYRPFDLLDHLGGDPLVVMSYRSAWTPGRHDAWVKWLDVAYGYFDDYALWQLDPPWRKHCRVAAAMLRAALRQANTVAREVVGPTLADGQIALVVTAEPAPGGAGRELQPALVLDSGAADRLRKAYEQVWLLYEETADALADVPPDQFAAKMPAPTDAPPSGPWVRTDRVWVLASTPRQAQRLAADTPPKAATLPADPKRPQATLAYVNWAGLVELAAPAVRDAARDLVRRLGVAQADEALVLEHVDTLLACAQALRSVTREVYVEDGALVTHTVWEVRDVK